MKNITLSLPENLLAKLKDLAHKRKKSLNKLAVEVLAKEVEEPGSWLAEHERLLSEIGIAPASWKWNREELYEEVLRERFPRL